MFNPICWHFHKPLKVRNRFNMESMQTVYSEYHSHGNYWVSKSIPRTFKKLAFYTYNHALIVFYQHPDIDECASAPCQNGGTCVDQVNGYLCQCAPGYTDLECQTGKQYQSIGKEHNVRESNYRYSSVFLTLHVRYCIQIVIVDWSPFSCRRWRVCQWPLSERGYLYRSGQRLPVSMCTWVHRPTVSDR